KRLPAYWFDSRRRYFAKAFGIGHAMAIDLVVLATYPLGWLKRCALRQRARSVPYYYRDFIRGSVLRVRPAPDSRLSPAASAAPGCRHAPPATCSCGRRERPRPERRTRCECSSRREGPDRI